MSCNKLLIELVEWDTAHVQHWLHKYLKKINATYITSEYGADRCQIVFDWHQVSFVVFVEDLIECCWIEPLQGLENNQLAFLYQSLREYTQVSCNVSVKCI